MLRRPTDSQQNGKEVYMDMDQWLEIRRRVLPEGVSARQILRETGMHWGTLKKILAHPCPPGYQRRQRPDKRIALPIERACTTCA